MCEANERPINPDSRISGTGYEIPGRELRGLVGAKMNRLLSVCVSILAGLLLGTGTQARAEALLKET